MQDFFEDVTKSDADRFPSNFALSLKYLLAIHNNLKCPNDVHQAFWKNHSEPTKSNFASILSRLSMLIKAQKFLCLLLRVCAGDFVQIFY